MACALALLTTGCVSAPASSVPTEGPGSDGPCAVTRRDVPNPAEWRHDVTLFEPTGTARPWTGGTCDDDRRPVVLLAHGYGGSAAEVYQGLADHLVGQGFVVVFPPYDAEFDPEAQYRAVDTGLDAALAATDREDTTRVGVVGHSFGGGMTPWLLQRVAERGWGARATWAVLFAPWYALRVGTGPIEVPARTRVAVVAYDEDVFVDNRIGIELVGALAVPADHKVHVTVRSDRSHDPALVADHLGPLSFPVPFLGTLSADHLDRWSADRTVDAVSGCALDGRWCDTDLGDVGRWPDGTAVRRAVVSSTPSDVGPPALQECEFPLNPRPCPTAGP
ncbi:MAG: alpha/beta hydrolase family protein [Microthrixaceae bacterium]